MSQRSLLDLSCLSCGTMPICQDRMVGWAALMTEVSSSLNHCCGSDHEDE
jgi:hypothetical protein